MKLACGLLVSVFALAACVAEPATIGKAPSARHPKSDDSTETADDPTTEPPETKPKAPARGGIEQFPGSKLFMPPKTPAPAIVMLHGSEGGKEPFIGELATDIAQKGFVVLALCWFQCPGMPDKILRAPLDRVVDAGQWLAGSPDVASGRVGLFGWSRGGEQAVLVTSLLKNADPFSAVFVHAPSDTVVGSYDPATEDGTLELDPKTGTQIPAPAWTWHGADIFGEPKSDYSVPGPRIRVEDYRGPLFVSAGVNDEIWEVSRSHNIVSTRNAAGGLVTESHFWAGEGHVLQQPANVTTFHAEIASFFQRQLVH